MKTLLRSPLRPALALAALLTFAPPAPGNDARAAELAADSCGFQRVANGREVSCWRLTVPARRDAVTLSPDQVQSYSLPVAMAKATGPKKGPPILFINGGPGAPMMATPGYAMASFTWLLEEAPWLEGRDLIIFDPRGVGAANPSIDCPKSRQKMRLDSGNKKVQQAMAACWRGLREAGIDLESFNTREAVADLKDLRQAMGIEQWDLLGASYGTRVALELLESDGEAVRAAILMGVYPPGVDSLDGYAAAFSGALQQLFDNCDAAPDCRKAYPDLAERFAALMKKRERRPKAISARLTRSGWTRTFRFELDGLMILRLLHGALYRQETVAELPGFIDELARGEFDTARLILDSVDFGYFGPNSGFEAFMLYECNDIARSAWSDRDRATEAHPLVGIWTKNHWNESLCKAWDLGQEDQIALDADFRPAERPVLILNGDLDPVTPSRWAALAAEHLPKSHFFRLRGNAHDTHRNACAKSMIADFLENPAAAPASACLADQEVPVFVIADDKKNQG